MKILDIDMDFFLHSVKREKPFDGIRLSDEEYIPWNINNVRNFLETKCCLSTDNRINGAIVTEHEGVFHILKALYDKELLKLPLEIVHIDSHADLGFGDCSWSLIFREILNTPLEKRLDKILQDRILERESCLSSGNYLLYMIALEWISHLTYIPHISLTERGDDFSPLIMKDFDDSSGIIQLKQYDRDVGYDVEKYEYLGQKEVEFKIVKDYEQLYLRNDFDYIFFSQSLSYTPKSADIFIDLFKEYIEIDKLRNSIA
ncbi:UPF0489 family protein [Fusibacter ferrireducens]|uniref:UPF0489 family protein n=1 Tax=Fusibacter ferrireducens TaxID=2785058 RepID=A0ABS0A021_9FIRM|nr:UPF0489 family protein [Fusibacter ferrireducens]MBF4696054.1 UPF0489 family protein [Fusibacter ferrireducens]